MFEMHDQVLDLRETLTSLQTKLDDQIKLNVTINRKMKKSRRYVAKLRRYVAKLRRLNSARRKLFVKVNNDYYWLKVDLLTEGISIFL